MKKFFQMPAGEVKNKEGYTSGSPMDKKAAAGSSAAGKGKKSYEDHS